MRCLFLVWITKSERSRHNLVFCYSTPKRDLTQMLSGMPAKVFVFWQPHLPATILKSLLRV